MVVMACGNYATEEMEGIADMTRWGVVGADGVVDRVQRTDESRAAAARIIEIENTEAMSLEGRLKSDSDARDELVVIVYSEHQDHIDLSQEILSFFLSVYYETDKY